jgi:hypothetical protein
MGIPTSEVGYTSAITGRENMKSMMDMWWHWIYNKKIIIKKLLKISNFCMVLDAIMAETCTVKQPLYSQYYCAIFHI